MNFHFLKKQLNYTPIVPMQSVSFDNILRLVQDCYVDNINMNTVIEEYFNDTKIMYHEAIQKSVIQNSLIAPNVRGLENEVISSPSLDPE